MESGSVAPGAGDEPLEAVLLLLNRLKTCDAAPRMGEIYIVGRELLRYKYIGKNCGKFSFYIGAGVSRVDSYWDLL